MPLVPSSSYDSYSTSRAAAGAAAPESPALKVTGARCGNSIQASALQTLASTKVAEALAHQQYAAEFERLAQVTKIATAEKAAAEKAAATAEAAAAAAAMVKAATVEAAAAEAAEANAKADVAKEATLGKRRRINAAVRQSSVVSRTCAVVRAATCSSAGSQTRAVVPAARHVQ